MAKSTKSNRRRAKQKAVMKPALTPYITQDFTQATKALSDSMASDMYKILFDSYDNKKNKWKIISTRTTSFPKQSSPKPSGKPKMKKWFKPDKMVVVRPGHENKCSTFMDCVEKIGSPDKLQLKIMAVDDLDNIRFSYLILSEGGDDIARCYSGNCMGGCFKINDVMPIEERQTINTKAKIELSKVVLTEHQRLQIEAALAQDRLYDKIFNDWGFGEVIEKGRAVSLLFYGPPGTGKTLTAQAIAEEVKRKLVVIGTAEIESSIPGEAERNLKRAFEKALSEKAVLLFDECDSLITDRNDVGMILAAQINALLTALENHEGIVLFTTNRLPTLDPAFQRRLACIVEFPFPDEAQRARIWERLIPKKAPVEESVTPEKLGRFALAGGNIKNVVLSAARLAAYKNMEKISEACFVTAIHAELKTIREYEEALRKRPNIPKLLGLGARAGKGGLELTKEIVDDMDIEIEANQNGRH